MEITDAWIRHVHLMNKETDFSSKAKKVIIQENVLVNLKGKNRVKGRFRVRLRALKGEKLIDAA